MFDGRVTRNARKVCPQRLWPRARRKLDQLNQAGALGDIGAAPGNRLEKLRGDRRVEFSIRINQQYRICFKWTVTGPEFVEIVDYHR